MDDSHKKRLYESNHEMPRLDGYHKSRHHLKPIKQSKMSRNLQMVVNIDTTINGITTTLKLSLATPLDGVPSLSNSWIDQVKSAITEATAAARPPRRRFMSCPGAYSNATQAAICISENTQTKIIFSEKHPKFLPTIQKKKLTNWNYYEGELLTEKKRSALVVDDGAISRKVCSTVLREMGYEVDYSDNGRDAVDRICPVNPATEDEVLEKTYDVIIMDCFMSVIDGLDTVAALRLGGYTGAIIGLSYDTLDDYSKRFRDSGCTSLLQKPLRPDTLRSTLKGLELNDE